MVGAVPAEHVPGQQSRIAAGFAVVDAGRGQAARGPTRILSRRCHFASVTSRSFSAV